MIPRDSVSENAILQLTVKPLRFHGNFIGAEYIYIMRRRLKAPWRVKTAALVGIYNFARGD